MNRASTASNAAEPNRAVCAALLAAESACRARGAELTPIRRSVLRSLIEAGQPLSAYNLLKRMEADLDRRVTPPTVYRALDFLLEQRLISKIESRSAFVPCMHPDHVHACVFFICDNCGSFEEIEDTNLERLFERKANSLGFRISKQVLELQGMCASCLDSGPLT
jgi:Fur family zinc uptake transcriptional regulator